MAKQCLLLEDSSVSGVLRGVIPQLHPPVYSGSDPEYTTFSHTYYPGESEIPESVAPDPSTHFYVLEAIIDFSQSEGDLQGVLMAQGGCFGGHTFYIYQGKLCYIYNWLGQENKITCDFAQFSSEVTLKVEFFKDKIITDLDKKVDISTIGEVKLYINNTEQNISIIRNFSNHTSNFLTEYKHQIPYEIEGAKLKKIIITITKAKGVLPNLSNY